MTRSPTSIFSELGALLADPEIEKIFHAAEYDLILMAREFDWRVNNLFDTMWAARILGYKKIGLANMLNLLFEVELDKKYQLANWGQRPLSNEQLAYAQRDTHYLFALRNYLRKELEEGNHLEEAKESFEKQANVDIPDVTFRPEKFWDMNGVKHLQPDQKGVGLALYIFRHQLAEEFNLPAFKIFDNKAILHLSQDPPSHSSELFNRRGMPRWILRKKGRDIIRVIRDAQRRPAPKRPKRSPRPSDDVLERYDLVFQWRKKRAQDREVESDVILSRSALWKIAKSNPKSIDELGKLSKIMGEWRYNQYGSEIIQLLTEFEAKKSRLLGGSYSLWGILAIVPCG